MKLIRITTVIAAAALTIGLAGCATSPEGPGNAENPTHEGMLTAGSTLSYPPFEFMEGDTPTGFEVELAETLAKSIGYDGVTWIATNFEGIIPGVATGKFDFAASGITGWAPDGSPALAVVNKRTEQVSFTTPHFLYPALIVTSSKKHPEITSVDQLTAGMKVSVVDGSHVYFWAQDVLAKKGVEVIAVKSGAQAYTQLAAGLIDATVDVKAAAVKAQQANADLQLGEEVPALTGGYGFAYSPSNDELRSAFSDALAKAVADGSYAKLYEKYFPGEDVPTLPTTAYPPIK